MTEPGDLKASNFIGTNSLRLKTTLFTISVVDYVSQVTEDWHFHEQKHILAVLKGGNLESRLRSTTELKPGDITSYREGETHCNKNVAYPSKNIIVEFNEHFFNSGTNFNNLNSTPSTFATLVKVYYECLWYNENTADSIYQHLYSMFINSLPIQFPKWLTTVKELLDDRWNEFVSLDELSLELNLHPVTISKYFSRFYDFTIAEYMRKIKVERAVQLLLRSPSRISEIAHHCGFSDQSHMTRLFKQYLGAGPRDIRSH